MAGFSFYGHFLTNFLEILRIFLKLTFHSLASLAYAQTYLLMPKRKATNGVSRRRTRKFGKKFKATVPSKRGFQPITNLRTLAPSKMLVNLRYSELFQQPAPGIGLIGVTQYRANSIFDPSFTFTGHQPRGFDQWMALYDHYVVIYATIKIEFQEAASEADSGIVVLAVRDTTTAASSMNTYRENSEMSESQTVNKNAGSRRLKSSINPNRYLGRSKPLSDPQLKGGIASNPTEQVLWDIVLGEMPGTVNAPATNFSVIIDYLAVLIEPKTPSQS